ncbi:MAG: restriction endonuclease [bacterium]
MNLLDELMQQSKKIDFLFPNSFEELMNDEYYDYDKFEWFLYYVFKLEGIKVQKVGKKGKGDGGADLILTQQQENGGVLRIGVQAKYWKNRVGTEPINQLASAQKRHDLSYLWIITTSDLTSDAKEIAESMDITILRAADVKKFIEAVKNQYAKEIKETGESSIEFLKREKKPASQSQSIKKEESSPKNLEETKEIALMKDLRKKLSKKYKLYPVYTVYNNDAMQLLIEKKPTSIEELSSIKGIGNKKIQMFGEELVAFIKENLIDGKTSKKAKFSKKDKELYDLLIHERSKIAKYNNISELDAYDNQTAKNMVKMKPRNKETLKKVYGFKQENIDLFGDYLIRKLLVFLDQSHSK